MSFLKLGLGVILIYYKISVFVYILSKKYKSKKYCYIFGNMIYGCVTMETKKLIISANEMTEVIYIGTNVNAKGGKKKRKNRCLGDRHADFTYDVLGRQIPVKQIVVAKYHVKNYMQRNKTRRGIIKELICNNFSPKKCVMITLTFADVKEENSEGSCWDIKEDSPLYESYLKVNEIENMPYVINEIFFNNSQLEIMDNDGEVINQKYKDLKTCNKEFKKFIQRMNYRYTDFKYVAVMGRQDNGKWHYHMVCNITFIEFDKLKQIWGLGSCYVQAIRCTSQLNKVINYAKKNMNNSSLDLKGEKGYLASKGLNRNIVLRSWVESEQKEFNIQKQRLEQVKSKVKYTESHITEHIYTGEVTNDGLFYDDKECQCICKYYTYPIESIQNFEFLGIAKKK